MKKNVITVSFRGETCQILNQFYRKCFTQQNLVMIQILSHNSCLVCLWPVQEGTLGSWLLKRWKKREEDATAGLHDLTDLCGRSTYLGADSPSLSVKTGPPWFKSMHVLEVVLDRADILKVCWGKNTQKFRQILARAV